MNRILTNEHSGEDSRITIRALVITVSSTRDLESDASGSIMADLISGIAKKTERKVISDSAGEITRMLSHPGDFNCIIFSGGTGPSRKDLTSATLRDACWKELPGFGELFRARSAGTAGIMAYLSDASMFIHEGRVIFAIPGSPSAQETAFQIIREIVFHAVREATKE
ncbi:MAG: molybdopterin-binding protein [Candidatus Thermoplasmatota archaeon]|nr:molybdopterin-binding protein [Candidatus Thermoplasmatota archaeon]MCL5437646.1 molybdopterin-binding protein [Candidatus Thermoplasmatota archaeon]